MLSRADFGKAVHDALAVSRFITPGHPEWDAIMRIPAEGEIKARKEDHGTGADSGGQFIGDVKALMAE